MISSAEINAAKETIRNILGDCAYSFVFIAKAVSNRGMSKETFDIAFPDLSLHGEIASVTDPEAKPIGIDDNPYAPRFLWGLTGKPRVDYVEPEPVQESQDATNGFIFDPWKDMDAQQKASLYEIMRHRGKIPFLEKENDHAGK